MADPRPIGANDLLLDPVPFRRALIAWGREHFRPFPWRLTDDPYRILLAEVMLHRTQARQVAPVYERFIALYPAMGTLARAGKTELHAVLAPLGLRWRIDLIHEMAGEIMRRSDGLVPRERAALLALPGVSDYIAGAVRCFAWNEPEPLVDTNTVRVVGRLFGLEIKDSSRRDARFRALIAALVDPEEPRAYNYALLDLADRICMKRRPPLQDECPVRRWCLHNAAPLTSFSPKPSQGPFGRR